MSQPSNWFRAIHWTISFALVIVTLITCLGLPYLRFDDDLENLFQGDSEEYLHFKAISREFGVNDDQCLILLSADDVLSVNSLKAIRRLDDALVNSEIVDRQSVSSLCLLHQPRRVFRLFFDVVPRSSSDSESDWLTAGSQLRQHPLGPGFLYSTDYSHTLIAFRFSDSVPRENIGSAIEAVKKIVESNWKAASANHRTTTTPSHETRSKSPKANANPSEADQDFGLTGLPILRYEVTRSLQRDQIKFTILGLLLATIVGGCLFRKIAPMFVVAVIPSIGLSWTMGSLGWLGMPLNIVNNVVTPLVLVIGFAEAVHILFVFGQKLGCGTPQHRAVLETLRQLFLPCSLAALTTAIGFGSLWFAEDKALQEFALVAVGGSTLMFLVVLLGTGCLIASPIGRYCLRNANPSVETSFAAKTQVVNNADVVPIHIRQDTTSSAYFPTPAWREHLWTMVAFAGLAVFAFVAFRNAPDYRFTENLPNKNNAVRTLQKIDEQFGGSSPIHIVIQLPGKTKLETLSRILELTHQKLESIDVISKPFSLFNLLQSMPNAEQGPRSQFSEFQNLPSEVRSQFMLKRPARINIRVQLPDIGSARIAPIVKRIQSSMRTVQQTYPEVKWNLAGLSVLAATRSEKMIQDLIVSLFSASFIIFVLILVVYRNLIFAISAIIVNAFPILGVAALMAWLETPIQYTSIMLLCTCLGLAVDDTVHFLSKTAQSLNDKVDFPTAVRLSQKKLWPILATTTAMLSVGFGLAATSDIPTFQSFGGYACVALLLALIGDLILLPSLLITFNRLISRFH